MECAITRSVPVNMLAIAAGASPKKLPNTKPQMVVETPQYWNSLRLLYIFLSGLKILIISPVAMTIKMP